MRLFPWSSRLSRTRLATAFVPWERILTPTQDAEGRRYRTDVPYLLPKDAQELHRLDFQQYVFRQVLQGNTFAPVGALLRQPCQVLDVGCGTGRWGMEIARTFPAAQVLGFDLETPPRSATTPRTYQFHQGNLLDGLPFAAQSFDYVHQVRPV